MRSKAAIFPCQQPPPPTIKKAIRQSGILIVRSIHSRLTKGPWFGPALRSTIEIPFRSCRTPLLSFYFFLFPLFTSLCIQFFHISAKETFTTAPSERLAPVHGLPKTNSELHSRCRRNQAASTEVQKYRFYGDVSKPRCQPK
jgi:hypothetical protein